MPSRTFLLSSLAFLLSAATAMAEDRLIEAESFDDPGGWVIDPQFQDIMGSPYLMAHGMGRVVDPAKTEIDVKTSGTWHVWVRCRDWIPSHHPGRFRLRINGNDIAEEFGTEGDGWIWQNGGDVKLAAGKNRVELIDLTGFDGRCDALYFTTDDSATPPSSRPKLDDWRRAQHGLPDVPRSGGEFDVIVVGGGISGCSATLAAARMGLNVALIQDRPVLGGNASSEISIFPQGTGGPIVDEVAGPLREKIITAEKTVTLFTGWRAFAAETEGDRVVSVDARNIVTGDEQRLSARTFIDCTGDGWVGYWAGAEFRTGREGRDEFNESMAPEEADDMTHGLTLYFQTGQADGESPFPDVPWARAIAKDHIDLRSDHSWEYGHWRDMIGEAEEIRDYLMAAIYGTFANVKAKFPAAANAELTWVNYIAARGESRRLVGDHVLSENEIKSREAFPDGVATGSLVFCLHMPREDYDFRSTLNFTAVQPYRIPFRSLYSRNISNLMMAGRCISATHVGFATTKLQKTGGQMGAATGAAAYLCAKYQTNPRGVYEEHLDELLEIVHQKGRHTDSLRPKDFSWIADDGRAKSEVTRTRAEVASLIAEQGKQPPKWFSSTPLSYPKSLDLSWPQPPPKPWNNRKNVGQYVWDIINPNPSRWHAGIRFMHHLLNVNRNDKAALARVMDSIGRMYFDFEADYPRAAFWWEKAREYQGDEFLQGHSGAHLAACYWRLGNREMAEELLNQLPNSQALIKTWADMGDLQRALEHAESAARRERWPQQVYLLAGDICRAAEQYDLASSYYFKVLSVPIEGQNQKAAQGFSERARSNIATIRLYRQVDLSAIPDGAYKGTSIGYSGEVSVSVRIADHEIASIDVTGHKETQYYSSITETPAQIVQQQSIQGVDAVSGATVTSAAIINATAQALAGAEKVDSGGK